MEGRRGGGERGELGEAVNKTLLAQRTSIHNSTARPSLILELHFHAENRLGMRLYIRPMNTK